MTYEPETNHHILGAYSGEPVSPSDIKRSEVAQRVNSLHSELEALAFMAADEKTGELFGEEIFALGECLKWSMRVLTLAQAVQKPEFRRALRA